MGSFARIGTAALGAIVVVLTAAQPWGQGSGAATTKARAVRMDFDGDGRTDFVTVSASGKYLQWTMKLSSEGLRLLRFGDNATDEPVPGGGTIHGVALLGQAALHVGRDVRLVFHQQDAHGQALLTTG